MPGSAWAASNGNSSSSTNTGGQPENSSNSDGNNGDGPSGSSGEENTQPNDYDSTTHGVNAQLNGSPNVISGKDHDLVGLEKADQTEELPAVGTVGVNGYHVNGTSDEGGFIGINIDGTHNDSNIEGVVLNNLRLKDAELEAFITAAKNSADFTIDLANAPTGPTYGSPSEYKVVYARGSQLNGTFTENSLHLSGSGTSYGLLVVEIDNPDNAQFIMSGSYKWVGAIIVVINKRPTGTEAVFDIRGGGNANHILGGAMIYHRNYANSATDSGAILSKDFYRTRGTSDLKFSIDALNKAVVEVRSSFKVRSWRELDAAGK
jgi:hypothetical protein